MNSSYDYDEHSQTWPVFVLAVASVTVVPVTIQTVYSALSGSSTAASNDVAGAITKQNVPSRVQSFRSRTKRQSALFSKKTLFLVLGWALIGYLVYVIHNTEAIVVGQSFDPYELLGVEFGSTEKEIKSVYKKLSVKFHPDKIRNKSEEEMKELEQKFVLITKAYKALTDEVTKENFEKYGNPDGPQIATHGIALPKWLIEGSTSPVLLAAYIAIIAFVLPYIVSKWWNKTKKVTKKGIRSDTATLFVEKLLNQKNSEIIRAKTIMNYLAHASEYEELLPGKSVKEIVELYEAYLDRKLTTESLKAVSIVPALINGLVDISAGFRNTEISIAAINTLKCFIQALPESPKNDLLQLPHVNRDAVNDSNIVRLGKLLTLGRDEIKKTLGIEDDAKLSEALDVAARIPRLDIVKAEFKVPGEQVVTPQSQAHIVIKVLVKSPAQHGIAAIQQSKLEEEETMEYLKDPYKSVFKQPQLPLAHAPYFPDQKQAGYIAFVILQKDGKIIESPVIFKHLDLSNLELTQQEFQKGEKLQVGTFKIPFQQPAPKELGKVQFRVVIKSLDYFTTDLDVPVMMHVQEPPKIEEVNYDIPLPTADSVAGAMAGLRGEGVMDDEDDSDLEEEDMEEDFTDIDSETDAEEEE